MLASRSPFYRAALAVQLAFYTAAVAGVLTRARSLRLASFLLITNFAILAAWFRYARGDRITHWSPSERPNPIRELVN